MIGSIIEAKNRVWLVAGILVLVALSAPFIAPYPPDAQLDILKLSSLPPSWAHPFGTDSFSRDLLSRVLYGARVSVFFSVSAVLLSLVVGTAYGAAASFGPGWLQSLLKRFIDVALSVPRLLVLLVVTAFIGPLSIPALVVLVALTGWFATARQVTDELESLGHREFVLAAQAVGIGEVRLFLRHLLPHLLPLLAVVGTLATAGTIALEAGLSFLGLGIQPPTASLGTILHDASGSTGKEWWIVIFPGITTVLAVMLCNTIGDSLRERLAPAQVASRSSLATVTPRYSPPKPPSPSSATSPAPAAPATSTHS